MKLAPVCLAIGLVIANVAYADKPTLVGLAPPPVDDARLAIAIGPSGQAYEPDGQGTWTRRHAGGTAAEVVIATRAGKAVIVGAKDAPPFKLVDGTWSSVYLGQHAKAIVGFGSRALAAVGRSIFALDRTPPVKLANAPGVVTALAGSPASVVITTDAGVFRLDPTGWIQLAQTSVALVTDTWGLVDRGAMNLQSNKIIAWPTDVRVVAAASPAALPAASTAAWPGDNTLYAIAVHGAELELLTVHAGKLDREPIAFDASATIIGVVADRSGRVVLAASDGRLAIRDHSTADFTAHTPGTWTTTRVREALPAPRTGPAPAISPR